MSLKVLVGWPLLILFDSTYDTPRRSAALRLCKRVIPLPSLHFQSLGVVIRDLDVDLPPLPVSLVVSGDVADRVLRPDLTKHLLVDLVEILDAFCEERRASGRFRNLRE